MNSTDTISGVERVNVGEPRAGYDPDGRRYWTRTIVCHGGGQTRTIVCHAESEDGVRLHFGEVQELLTELTAEELDDLIAAAKTERMARDGEPVPCGSAFGVCGQCGEATLNGICTYSGCPTGEPPAPEPDDAALPF